jgi:multicomponent Na+:H+ antiporter subunit E
MDAVDRAGFAILLSYRFVAYLVWLVGEVFRANVRVVRIILSPRLPISPIVVPFKAHQKTDLCKVIYANSITLTPGTITTGVEGDMLRIHALTWKDIDGREEDKMDQMICRLESPEDQR